MKNLWLHIEGFTKKALNVITNSNKYNFTVNKSLKKKNSNSRFGRILFFLTKNILYQLLN